MRYFILSAHGGIGYLAALRILDQDPNDVCTFLVPFGETEIWTADPRLVAHVITKAALIVTGDAQNIDDIQRAWHTAEMGIDSERSGIEAVIISDISNHRRASDAEELLSILKCFPAYPYPAFSTDRKLSATYSTRTQSTYSSRTTPLYIPRSPSYSVRPPRLIVVSPSRSLKRLRTGPRESKEESLIAWATGKKAGSSTTFIPSSASTEPSTPIHSDSRSTHSAYSGQLTPHGRASLFPEEQKADVVTGGGWLDPKCALIVRPAVLMRRRCRGDETRSSTPYRIQEEFTLRDRGGGWTISKRDVAHFIVEKALEEWSTWGGRRVRIAY